MHSVITSFCRRPSHIVLVFALGPTIASAQDIKVTLLGTGAPAPVMSRLGPSTLVEAGGHKFLFDAGRGALQRLTQLQVRWQDVDGVFLTHLHSDHVVGLPDLLLTGWLVNPGRNRPLRVWGPKGTENMISHLRSAYEFDIRFRQSDDRAMPEGITVRTQEIAKGVVLRDGDLTVTAFEVDHGPVRPAFGYRIDYGGHSVVLSGDTRVSENLIRYAERVDLLIHEVAVQATFERAGVPAERVRAVMERHVSPRQAGEIFARTKPRLAVYSHIAQSTANEQDVIPPTRERYTGRLELGEDLMVIEIGESVEVRRPPRGSP
jgi:ribonuclease Z